jgi:hypothetical protein
MPPEPEVPVFDPPDEVAPAPDVAPEPAALLPDDVSAPLELAAPVPLLCVPLFLWAWLFFLDDLLVVEPVSPEESVALVAPDMLDPDVPPLVSPVEELCAKA